MNDKFCDLSYSRIRISRGLDAHSKNWSGNWEQSWSRMMSVPYILMTKVISRWWRWFRHLPLLGNTELQNIARKLSTNGFKIWKMHIPETWKIILFIYLLQHPKPNFIRQSFIFSLYQNQVWLHNEQEKFERKQSAILRLIKSITKLSNVIGYHQPDLSTYNIPKKITRVWLAENGFFFYVTRVQSCNTSADDK